MKELFIRQRKFRGPLKLEEYEKFKKLTKQLDEAENKLDDKESLEAAKEAFEKLKDKVEFETIKNGTKNKEELDKEYEYLIKEFVETTKKGKEQK